MSDIGRMIGGALAVTTALGMAAPHAGAQTDAGASSSGDRYIALAENGGGGGESAPTQRLQPVTVVSEATSDEQPVGPYGQPAWTARQQRWGTTRAYVLPPYVFEAEAWWVGEFNEDAGPNHEFIQELKIGLPHRFQVDFYQIQKREAGDTFDHAGTKVEFRWALADWGEIPLNPTLYFEWEHGVEDEGEDEDELEYKLLLADTLGEKWHWAGNLIYEHSLREHKNEYAASMGLSRAIIPGTFSAGLEAEAVYEDEGDEHKDEYLLGPSFEWRPSQATSLRFSPLFGLGPDSPDMKVFAILGFEFGPGYGGSDLISGYEDKRGSGPAATELR